MDSSSALFEPPAIVFTDKPGENGHSPDSSSAKPRLALDPGMSLRAAARAVLAFQFRSAEKSFADWFFGFVRRLAGEELRRRETRLSLESATQRCSR
jgi:hypothetical protein